MTEPKKFRKKPVVIEALRWDGSLASIQSICLWANYPDMDKVVYEMLDEELGAVGAVYALTLEGALTASVGDFIIRGVQGEFYPCKPDIFEATYEEVSDD